MHSDANIYGIPDETVQYQKMYKRIMLIFFVLIVGGGVIWGLFHHTEDVITVTDDQIVFELNEAFLAIDLADIETLELVEKLNYVDEGEKARTDGCIYGEGTNDKIGGFVYYLYEHIDTCIILKTEKQTVVFNYINKNNTKGFYEALEQLVNER